MLGLDRRLRFVCLGNKVAEEVAAFAVVTGVGSDELTFVYSSMDAVFVVH